MAKISPKIATFCLEEVKKCTDFDVQWAEFNVIDQDRCGSYIISPNNLRIIYEDGNPISLIEMHSGFLMSIGLVLDYPRKTQLIAISIHFYDKEKLLLRTDWSYQDYLKGVHAQPHWHFSPLLKGTKESLRIPQTFAEFDGFSNYDKEETPSKTKELDLSRMHLYMAYTEKNASLNLQELSVLRNWLGYTLSYMNDQFCLLEDHHYAETTEQ